MTPKRRIIPIFVPHVGCPNDCVFCNQRKISGALEPATAQSVERDIRLALAGMREEDTPAELAFYGGSFTAIPWEDQLSLLGAVSPFLRSGRIDRIRVSTRPDCIKEDNLMRLKELGVKTIELGAQSMDEEVLRLSGRGHTADDTVKASKIVKSCGMALILQMMTGLPGDTPEKSIETARCLSALSPEGVRIYPTVIIKDTKLFDMWQSGEYEEHTVENAIAVCAQIICIFAERNIPIIRLGLNPTDSLSKGEAVAGAYHPAFGELVYSRVYREKAEELLKDKNAKGAVFGVAKGRMPIFIGQKRCNARYFEEKYDIKRLKVVESDIKDGEIVLLEVEN